MAAAMAENPDPVCKFVIQPIAGAGNGMLATCDIEPGQVILREKPLIVMPEHIFDMDDTEYVERWLDKKINALSAADREAFFTLAQSRTVSDEDSKNALGIFYTNDMTFTGNSAAVFITMSRVNHSCAPNADFIARDQLGVQDLVATSHIVRGQQITISYLPSSGVGTDLRRFRRHYTRLWYGFECRCAVCILQGDQFWRDEKLRERLKRLQARELCLLSAGQLEELLDLLRRVQAKLPYQMDVCEQIYQHAVSIGDQRLAAKCASVAYLAASIMLDSSESDVVSSENPWQPMVNSTIVCIAGNFYAFTV